jgi:hypothetical protein
LALFLLAVDAAPGTAWAVASAELYRTQPYGYGRFEARLRFAPGDGVVSSFFLWKNGSEMTGVYWNELDFEKVGGDCHLQTNALHGIPAGGHEQSHMLPSDLCGAYHDYVFEWTPTYIAWAIDGQEIRRDTGETAAAFAQHASTGMQFRFNVWPGNASFGGNFDAAILPVHQFVSWVQYSAYLDGSFEVQWREEFDARALPSGWATGNWASPYNLSTHAAQNVNFVGGIAVLSLTADDAVGFMGVPPADSGGSGGTAGSDATGGSGASTGSGGSGGPAQSSGGSDDACGCRVPGSRERGLTIVIAGALVLVLLRRRSRSWRSKGPCSMPGRETDDARRWGAAAQELPCREVISLKPRRAPGGGTTSSTLNPSNNDRLVLDRALPTVAQAQPLSSVSAPFARLAPLPPTPVPAPPDPACPPVLPPVPPPPAPATPEARGTVRIIVSRGLTDRLQSSGGAARRGKA